MVLRTLKGLTMMKAGGRLASSIELGAGSGGAAVLLLWLIACTKAGNGDVLGLFGSRLLC